MLVDNWLYSYTGIQIYGIANCLPTECSVCNTMGPIILCQQLLFLVLNAILSLFLLSSLPQSVKQKIIKLLKVTVVYLSLHNIWHQIAEIFNGQLTKLCIHFGTKYENSLDTFYQGVRWADFLQPGFFLTSGWSRILLDNFETAL